MAQAGRLAGRRVIVTGAGSGIGRAVARMAAAEGARVGCLDRDGAAASGVAAALAVSGHAEAVDVADPEAVRRAVGGAAAVLGGLDGLVNSAGVVALGKTAEMPPETWRKVIEVNLGGTFFMCQAAIPHLLAA